MPFPQPRFQGPALGRGDTEKNFHVGPASQTKKFRKRFCWVEPAPLRASSYTHLLYKVQNPFSACRQSKFQNKFLMILKNIRVGPVFASQTKKLRKRFCRVEPAPWWASSYTHFLYKAQDPFGACRQSKFQNKFLMILKSFDVGPVFAL